MVSASVSLFERLRGEVSALDAAHHYGLEFGRNKRARCPWHNDHHPDLKFFPDGSCYCFSCHQSADAVGLVARILGLSQLDAAKQLAHDFGIADIDGRPDPALIEKRRRERREERERREAKKRQFNRRWGLLCDIAREADQELRRFTDPDAAWEDPRFVQVLTALARSNLELDIMWETEGITNEQS